MTQTLPFDLARRQSAPMEVTVRLRPERGVRRPRHRAGPAPRGRARRARRAGAAPDPDAVPAVRLLVGQADTVQVAARKTSGEAEWALVVGDDPTICCVTVRCDHTDRELEVHGVAWSKQSAPDVLGDLAWR